MHVCKGSTLIKVTRTHLGRNRHFICLLRCSNLFVRMLLNFVYSVYFLKWLYTNQAGHIHVVWSWASHPCERDSDTPFSQEDYVSGYRLSRGLKYYLIVNMYTVKLEEIFISHGQYFTAAPWTKEARHVVVCLGHVSSLEGNSSIICEPPR